MVLRLIVIGVLLAPGGATAAEVVLARRAGHAPIEFGIQRLHSALTAAGHSLKLAPLDDPGSHITVIASSTDAAAASRGWGKVAVDPAIADEGYRFVRMAERERRGLAVVARDTTGAMYALLDLAEQIRAGVSAVDVPDRLVNPRFALRAVKFNLPWMSYRKHESLQLHDATCRDLKFWSAFLDMMAENRFNALTLWNLHPFTFMIRPKNFREACPFDDRELAQWQEFWRTLFRMARDRGIDIYLVNWNIFVSPELARAHNVAKYSIDWSYGGDGDTSELVKRYTRQCVTQVIDEYPDLAGLGITLGERTGGMTPQQREDWLLDTVIAGMKAARRPVKFIHRAPLSANKGWGGSSDDNVAAITRAGIDKAGLPGPVWVEMKFNWSHGHSSPRLSIIHGGKASEGYWQPKPANYKLTWMIRNEDFFILRWGEPDFVREHIRLNGEDYVGGYFVGSECYIPAANYVDRADAPARARYAFERQWLFYSTWGRLLFDPGTPDSIFEHMFDARYGKQTGKPMFAAWKLASRTPLRLASFYRATWDFTLYSEGFLNPAKGKSPDGAFISVEDLIKSPTLDPAYVSIREFVDAQRQGQPPAAGRLTPLELADALEADARNAMKLVEPLAGKSAALDAEITDIKAWSQLGLYFAHKLRGAVALEAYRRTGDRTRQEQAITHLEAAAKSWERLVDITRVAYPPVPLIHLGPGKTFAWTDYSAQVQRDLELARQAR